MRREKESNIEFANEKPKDGVHQMRPAVRSDQSVSVNAVPNWLVPVGFFTAILFLAAILILAVKDPTPTPFQFIVFRILIALFGAAFSTTITGFLTVRMHFSKQVQIVAGGALAVFIVLYFFSPAIPGISKLVPLVD